MEFEEFIKRVKEVHGNKYIYRYINNNKVSIICSKHGEFFQNIYNHLGGQNCPKCTGNAKKTTDEFIKDAIKVHGNRYDYSCVDYKNAKYKICIICNIHGKFFQSPTSHLGGKNCSKCAGNTKKTTDEFIKNAIKVHGNRYDYSKSVYVNAINKINIHCKYHGDFLQTPNSHLRGNGCPKCKVETICLKSRFTTDEFIKRARNVHGNRYDYSYVEYIKANIKVKIFCLEHNLFFFQAPSHHLNGQKCRLCSSDIIRKKNLSNTEEFIGKSKKVHGDRYNYSCVDYINAKTSVVIICNIHGQFNQSPTNHLRGFNCPKCNKITSKSSQKWLDKLKIPEYCREKYIKIGRKKFYVDGLVDNIVYEFNGDFWHGNPKIYNKDDINIINKKTFGELYDRTIKKQKILEMDGYRYISIWESEFNDGNK